MPQSTALRFSDFGKPLEQLKLETIDLPDPAAGEVLIEVLAAPIHPSDFGVILGKYGTLPDLPATAGREGIGRITALGEGVEGSLQDALVQIPQGCGAWQSCCVAPAQGLRIVPGTVPVEMAAMAFVNPPTAWRLLRDADLTTGDWVIQNAANSAVGINVIQMARKLGLKTINLVRREELIQPLQEMGGDIVILDTDDAVKGLQEQIKPQAPLLALNSVGGQSALRMVKALDNGGTHITFGAMSFEEVRFPTRELIFKGVSLRGFWMDKWLRSNSGERVQVMFDKIYDLLTEGSVSTPVEATYPLEEFQQAIAHAGKPRLGKVLFKPVAR